MRPQIKFVDYATFISRTKSQLQAAGKDTSEEALHRNYNQQRQIFLYQLGAKIEAKLIPPIEKLGRQIREEEDWLYGPHIVEGQNPIADIWTGPAGAWGRAQQMQEEIEQRSSRLEKLRAHKKLYDKAKQDIESVLPLLGGLDEKGLQVLASLQGNTAQFKELASSTLSKVFNNIEKSRGYLQSGEVSVWSLLPVVNATRKELGVPFGETGDVQEHWNHIIMTKMSEAKADKEKLHRFLEVLKHCCIHRCSGHGILHWWWQPGSLCRLDG